MAHLFVFARIGQQPVKRPNDILSGKSAQQQHNPTLEAAISMFECFEQQRHGLLPFFEEAFWIFDISLGFFLKARPRLK